MIKVFESNRVCKGKKLTEKNWKYNLPNTIRRDIEDESYEGVCNTLISYVEQLYNDGIMDEDDYEEFLDDINNQLDNLENYEDYDMTEEDVVDEIDYILNDFYDWCDANGVFIEI